MIGNLIGVPCTAVYKANSSIDVQLEDVENWKKFDDNLGVFRDEFVEIKCLGKRLKLLNQYEKILVLT